MYQSPKREVHIERLDFSRQSRQRVSRVLLATVQRCEGTCHERHMPVARTDEACKMMILTWSWSGPDVAWGLGAKVGSEAH